MSDQPPLLPGPGDLATVWANAVGQLTDIAMAALGAMTGLGGTPHVPGDDRNEITVKVVRGGVAPRLRVGALVGESFGGEVPGSQVVSRRSPTPDDPESTVFMFTVDERLAQPIT